MRLIGFKMSSVLRGWTDFQAEQSIWSNNSRKRRVYANDWSQRRSFCGNHSWFVVCLWNVDGIYIYMIYASCPAACLSTPYSFKLRACAWKGRHQNPGAQDMLQEICLEKIRSRGNHGVWWHKVGNGRDFGAGPGPALFRISRLERMEDLKFFEKYQ